MKPFDINEFTDPVATAAYRDAILGVQRATTVTATRELRLAADAQREQTLERGSLLQAAFTYLALAQSGTPVGDTDPEKFFHFAANAFRDLGQLQRAAECYYNSALAGYQKSEATGLSGTEFAKRSAGRAKTIFADLGEDEPSDDAHVLLQTIKRNEFKDRKSHLLCFIYYLWDLMSRYGTSPSRWATSMAMTIGLFAFIYAFLINTRDVTATSGMQSDGLAFVTSSVYYSLGNLLQFGTLGALTPQTCLAQLVFMLHGLVAFVLIGTGASFLGRR